MAFIFCKGFGDRSFFSKQLACLAVGGVVGFDTVQKSCSSGANHGGINLLETKAWGVGFSLSA